MSVLSLDSITSQKCTSKARALEAVIHCLEAEILDLIYDIAELQDRRDDLEHQQDGLRTQLTLLVGQEEGGR